MSSFPLCAIKIVSDDMILLSVSTSIVNYMSHEVSANQKSILKFKSGIRIHVFTSAFCCMVDIKLLLKHSQCIIGEPKYGRDYP